MPSITIRDVPEETRAELAARAASSGRSLQEYLRSTLVDLAGRPDVSQLLDRIQARKRATRTNVSVDRILDDLDADRR